ALDGPGERLVLYAFDDRGRLEVEHALAWPDQRRRGDEAGELVAGEQRFLERRRALNAGRLLGMRLYGADEPIWVSALPENLAALERMIAKRRPALVVEVVQKADNPPLVFALAELPRIAAKGCLDGQRVLQQAFSGRVLIQQAPRFVAVECL